MDISDHPKEQRWLIKDLWIDQGVGIIGGQPKCCKSFLALDMAVATAAGTLCLGSYPVQSSGRVLLFAAEDALHMVKQRLVGIAARHDKLLSELDIQVITSPVLRLDDKKQQDALAKTVESLKPKLLILDPFIRLHSIDENNSAEVARLLAFLRTLNRKHQLSIAVVHHARKGSGG